MPRPKRPRYIDAMPRVTEFSPRGISPDEKVILTLEEFEAVRLVDHDGLDQSRTAEIMNVSRQTVGRILRTGRFKLAKAVVKGCHLEVSGGCYRIDQDRSGRGRHRRRRGGRCGHPDRS